MKVPVKGEKIHTRHNFLFMVVCGAYPGFHTGFFWRGINI